MANREMAQKARTFVLKGMYIVNTILIVCHLGFTFIFGYYNMNALLFINFGNIAFCLLAFESLRRKKPKRYVHLALYELYAFMISTVIFLGWGFGFQFYCISFTMTIFFCDFYLNRNMTISKNSVRMGIFNMLLYITLNVLTHIFPPVYNMSDTLTESIIYIANTVLTFTFLIMYMFIYSTTVNKLENELRHIAERDPLTGLYNRRKMMNMLNNLVDSENNEKIAVAMFDADFFKKVNDTYGHDAGDEVLKNLADILENHNSNDEKFSVCRWGGEEFLAMYRYDGTHEAVVDEFEGLRKAIESRDITYEDVTIKITVTIGLAFYRNGKSLADLLKEADDLLYNGKMAGRNRVSYMTA